MKTSESIKNIAQAVFTFHSEMGKIPKNSNNPFFKSKYAPLPDILTAIADPMQKAGLTYMQFPKGENELETIVMHPESGEWMSECYYMKPTKQDPQAFGSVITYQRRYALGAILGLNIDEDDDGNKASEPRKKQEPVKATAKKPALTPEDQKLWSEAIKFLKGDGTVAKIKAKYELSQEHQDLLTSEAFATL